MSSARRPSPRPAALALAAALAAPAAARAQLPVPGVNPFSFGVEAGPAFPVGGIGDALNTGFTVGALAEARLPALPIGVRVEAEYARFGVKNESDNVRVFSGTANAVLRLSPVALSLVRPYLIGGVGIYGVNQGQGAKAGVNIGGGVSVPLVAVTAFADVRYTRVFTDAPRLNYVPLRVGVRF